MQAFNMFTLYHKNQKFFAIQKNKIFSDNRTSSAWNIQMYQ